jgi:hypothetical protein
LNGARQAGEGQTAVPRTRARYRDVRTVARPIALDFGILSLTALAIVAAFTISPALLTHWKVQYVTAGGSFPEKLHPATYLIVAALCLALLRHGHPVRGLGRIGAGSAAVPLYLVCWLFLLTQTLLLERPFTGVVDTFLLPLLLALTVWQVPLPDRRSLALLVHMLILLNVAIGYYEYFAGQRIIPLTLGNVVVIGEWRSAALFGHPLVASGLVGAYVLALTLRPQLCPQPLARLPLIAVCLGSLMVFGGRTALLTTVLITSGYLTYKLLCLLRYGRVPLTAVIIGSAVALASVIAVFGVLEFGLFDRMILRFSSDKGSALARLAMLDLLGHLDWQEIMLGPAVSRANALQSELGLDYGIENFWIASIVQFGLIHTLLITLGLAAFFVMLMRRSSSAALAVLLLMAVIAASSVSFSSKNIQLAQFVILITVLLPRQTRSAASAPALLHPSVDLRRARPVPAGGPS